MGTFSQPISRAPTGFASRRRELILLALAWLVALPSLANGAGPESGELNVVDLLKQPWRISRFPELEGKGLRCIAEDHQGNIWFGIRDGVIRYDGYTWQQQGNRQGLPVSAVNWLATRAAGPLVAATQEGLFEQDGSRWKRIFPRQDNTRVDLSFVTESGSGTLWACSAWGLLRVDDGRSTLYTDQGSVAVARRSEWFDEVTALPDGCVPRGRLTSAIDARVLGDTIVSFKSDSVAEEAGLEIGDRILAVNGDWQDITLGLDQPPGTELTLEIQKANGGEREVVSLSTNDMRRRAPIPAANSILVDSIGRVWVGMTSGTAIMSPDSGSSWVTWTSGQGLDVASRPYFLETEDGLIYCFSTGLNSSVATFDGESWSTESLRMHGSPTARSVAVQAANGAIWACSLDMIHVLQTEGWTTLDTRRLKVPSQGHRMLAASDGALWIGGYDQGAVRVSLGESEFTSLGRLRFKCVEESGAAWFLHTRERYLMRRDGDRVQRFTLEDGIITNPAAIVSVPNVGVVAIGAHESVAAVSTYDGSTWNRQVFPDLGRTLNGRAFAVTDEGKVWVAAQGLRRAEQVGGVLYGIGDDWQHFRPPYAPRFCNSALEFPDGRLWFTGSFGATQYDGEQWTRVADPLLSSDSIPAAAIGSDGVAWLATRTKGVLRFEDGDFQALSVDQGLPTNEITQVYVDDSDHLWVGTWDGIFRFDGKQFVRFDLAEEYVQFPIRPDGAGGVWINGRERFGYDASPPRGELLRTNLSVQNGGDAYVAWTGVDKWNRTPEDQLYWSWRVDDGPWSAFVQRNDTTISGLDVGDHSFELRARDADFNIVQLSQKALIAVAPPLWKTASFIAPAFVSASLLLWLAIRLFLRGMALRQANRDLDQAREQVSALYAERTAQFKAVCDCSPVGIFVTDRDYNVTYVNPYFARIAGRGADTLTNRGWLDYVHPEDQARIGELWDGSSAQTSSIRGSGRFLHQDGEVRHFELMADSIEENGEVLGYVGAIEDVTSQVAAQRRIESVNQELRSTLDQLKSAQEKVIQRERLTALGEMAAGVAHDINNSLTPLLTYAELLEEEPGLSSNGKVWAHLVRLGVRDTAGTVRRLDHFYRDEQHSHSFQRVEIDEIVRQTIELTRPRWSERSENGGCDIEVTANIVSRPVVQGDPSQLRAVLTNLIFNSVDAISTRGKIVITVQSSEDMALVKVADNGAGMTAEQVKRCTDPFYTSKKHGSGLGLSECYGIVRQHRGQLTVDSNPGQGTVVRFEIPMVDDASAEARTDDDPQSAAQEPPPAADAIEPENTNAGTATVLCIDDDEAVRASTVALLQSRGINVKTASDGPSGLDLMEQEQFQLVLCDQGLPGMDGVSVMKNIKSRWPHVRVAMVSGWSVPPIEGDVQPDAVIQKPFTNAAFDDLLS